MNSFVLKGDFIYCDASGCINTKKDGYAVCLDGRSLGVFDLIPENYRNLDFYDYSGMLVMPALTDLHVHAPQYTFRGTGMDLELMEWLDRYTFPAESKYTDPQYADEAYGYFVDDLTKSSSTRVCMFATNNIQANLILMEKLEKSGLVSYVGLTAADRNVPSPLVSSADENVRLTYDFIEKSSCYENTHPIVTPRFVPACSDYLLKRLAGIQKEFSLPLQSHLSENPGEIETVRTLCPDSLFYGDVYDKAGAFGSNGPVIMAHCVYSSDDEIALIKKNGVYVAHCPQSNTNLSSGIAPVRRFLNEGINLGLGSDIAGGHCLSMFRAVTDAVQMSKLYWRCIDSSFKPLSFAEAFRIGTLGGGSFFGNVGSFDSSYEFDALVINDSFMKVIERGDIETRTERAFYAELDRFALKAKFCRGTRVL